MIVRVVTRALFSCDAHTLFLRPSGFLINSSPDAIFASLRVSSFGLRPKRLHQLSLRGLSRSPHFSHYRTQDPDLELPRIFCLKTCGSWLLMRNRLHNLYAVNLFTKERIDLPPVESQVGTTKLEQVVVGFRIKRPNGSKPAKPMHIRSHVFWIDEETIDYIVLRGLGTCCVVYSKKGDNSWTQIPEALDCCDMIYKDHKLYFLSYSRDLRIFDFSGEVLQQSFWCRCVYVKIFVSGGPRRPQPSDRRRLCATKLVVAVTGDVLKVETFLRFVSRIWSFHLYKVCSLGLFKRVYSLGDESMLLDLGITVLANNYDGIYRNSIYFNGSDNISQVISFSSISRHGRWSNYTNLIARLINSLEIDGSYQVSHRQ